MKRREFITLIAGLTIAWPLACYAQQPQSPLPKRIGFLVPGGCPIAPNNSFARRLAELGWFEGRNFVFDCVSARGRLDQLPELARELVTRRPDVLIAGPHTFVRALKQETTTIPIVMLGGWEPVRQGLITSLAQPGGNVTGVAWLELLPKQMELLKEIIPHMRRVAHITDPNPPPEVRKTANEYITNASSTLGFRWQFFRPTVTTDYDEIFSRLGVEHFDAAYISGTPANRENVTHICQLALRHRIPAVSESADFAKGGLLLTYGQDINWGFTRASEYVDKILHGAKPSDLPVEQATKYELTINLKTAKALGVTVPTSLLDRADEVIE